LDGTTIIGCAVLTAALVTVTALTFWSLRRINRIARRGSGTARAIAKKLDDRS